MASSNLSMPCSASSFNMQPVTPSTLTLSKYITLEERKGVRVQEREGRILEAVDKKEREKVMKKRSGAEK